MDVCLNCPYKVNCVFDPCFPCFLDDPEKIKLKVQFNGDKDSN